MLDVVIFLTYYEFTPCRGTAKGLQVVVVFPKLLPKALQQLPMVINEGGQLLVVSSFMNPTESMFWGNVTKLRDIITEQIGDNRYIGLMVISRQGGCFSDAGLLLCF